MIDDDKRDKQRVSLAQMVRQIRDEMPLQIELAHVQASLVKARYDAFVRVGFTPGQALFLCKA